MTDVDQAITLPDAKPRGRPFAKGNPGRPPGARNRTSLVLEEMLDGEAEALVAKVIELAREGDRQALRLLVNRLLPVRSSRPVTFDLPPIESAADCATALTALLGAVAAGDLTPNEAGNLSQLLALLVRAFEAGDFERRIEALEKRFSGQK